MAISYINSAEYNSGDSNSAVVNKPTNTTQNDIMFALVFRYGSSSNSVPSGWTKLGENYTPFYFELFYKIAGSSEPSSYTWGFSSINMTRVILTTYRGGFNISNPIDVVSNTLYNVSNTTMRAASMTTTSANEYLFFFGSIYSASGTYTLTTPTAPENNWVADYDSNNTTSKNRTKICHSLWSSSGATGNIDSTISLSTNDRKHAFAVALNPEPAQGPVNLKSYNTNLKANIKSINGNPIANVKSLNTNV